MFIDVFDWNCGDNGKLGRSSKVAATGKWNIAVNRLFMNGDQTFWQSFLTALTIVSNDHTAQVTDNIATN